VGDGGVKIFRINAFSSKVYGLNDNGDVMVAQSDALLCELGPLTWTPVAPHKVPVTLRRWIDSQGIELS
jgi:hypothetical protein